MDKPLTGVRVIEHAKGVAGAYAGRLLSTLGAETIMAEPERGSPLRTAPPMLERAPEVSALFTYLAAGKRSVVCDPATQLGRAGMDLLLRDADILIDDTPVAERAALGLDPETIERHYPGLVYVSVLPFGAAGPKADWRGHEINMIHASGEGFLLPNGLTVEMFPDRPPLKIYGHFASMQGGIAAALGALSALWMQPDSGGQFVDIAVQDAALAVGAFAIQRLGDGSVEHRVTRSFAYGGVLECRDGFVEVLTLEERQWTGMVELMGSPDWARDAALDDALERSRRGREINGHIRAWARQQSVGDAVARAQALGVPMAPYNAPADVLNGPQERSRGLFQEVEVPGFGPVAVQAAPFHFDGVPLALDGGPPVLGQDQVLLQADAVP